MKIRWESSGYNAEQSGSDLEESKKTGWDFLSDYKRRKDTNAPSSDSYVAKACGLSAGSSNRQDGREVAGGGEANSEYRYEFKCIDYVAKFKKNGAKEWLTLVDVSSTPVIIGETSVDYRMLTNKGMLISVNKNGVLQSTINVFSVNNLNYRDISKGFVENDGSTVFLANLSNNLVKISATGQIVAMMSLNGDSGQNSYYYPVISRVSDGYLLTMGTDDGSSDVNSSVATVVKMDKNLSSTTPVTLNGKSGNYQFVLSSDKEDNMMILDDLELVIGDSGDPQDVSASCRLASYDKNGNLIAKTERKELTLYEIYALFLSFDNDFVKYEYNVGNNSASISKVTKYNKYLQIEYEYEVDEHEMIFDAAALNDGSLVGVGFALGPSANYPVDGSMNGVYFRMTSTTQTANIEKEEKEEKKENQKNPNTFDAGLSIAIALGSISIFGVGLAGRKIYKNM